jgi:hypothetical protein
MFIQVIKGSVSDRDELRRRFDSWREQLAAGAAGWLGATGGITDDGQFVGVVRFESPEAARANSDRPEQGEWWAETAKCFVGDVTFTDCIEVDQMWAGGSDDAGFVQVIEGRATDRDRLRQLGTAAEDTLRARRPDILGGTIAWHGDGEFTQTVYFTSEKEAREGEKRELPESERATGEEFLSLMTDLRYYDLREPWLYSP